MYTLLFFGALTDTTGGTQQRLEKKFTNVNALNAYLQQQYPGMEKHPYKIAVNGEFCCGDKILEDGDEIAFLPPFAGG